MIGKIAGVLALLLVLAFVGAYAASPLFAFHQLQQAAKTGDRDRLEALVDFPAVREDLRAQTESKATRLAKEAGGVGHPLAAIIGRAAGEASDRAVARYVTPDALAEMIRTGRAARGGEGSGGKADKVKVRFAYLTPDRVRVTISPSKGSAAAVSLIMDRRGLFSWRVERIGLRALADEDMVKGLY